MSRSSQLINFNGFGNIYLNLENSILNILFWDIWEHINFKISLENW